MSQCPLNSPSKPLHDLTFIPISRLIGVLRFLNLSNDELKRLGDVLIVPCTCLCVRTVKLLRQRLALLDGDLALIWTQIALIPNNNDGNPFRALETSVVYNSWSDEGLAGPHTK